MKFSAILICFVFCFPENSFGTVSRDWKYEEETNLINVDLNNQNEIVNITQISSGNSHKSNDSDKTNHHDHVKVTRIQFRYIPFLYRDGSKNDCVPNSSEDFPDLLFTLEQKRQGAVLFHFFIGIYCFSLLAVVCNDYFLPSVELICEKMNLSQDVAAATFMSIATSAPEFFVNVVATFITESDIGIGTIVGSSMFNTLGVAALGGLACKSTLQLDWWPITRDSVIYIITVLMLILMAKDEKIQWYESLILLVFYLVYFLIMWQNKRIYNLIMKVGHMFKRKGAKICCGQESTSTTNSVMPVDIPQNTVILKMESETRKENEVKPPPEKEEEEEEPFTLCGWPAEKNMITKAWWIFSWPIRLVLKCTIPDCRRYPRLFPLTFIMCVVLIGTNSYVVSWMITVIGTTLQIPDFVMGVTFLAAGGCLPEAISIVIVARKGQGGMGVSNSLGANTLDILLCLGLPWFIKTMVSSSSGGTNYIQMDSDSLFYTIIALIMAVLILYICISFAGYKLNKKVSTVLIITYVGFLAMAISLELFLYYDGKLYPCNK